MHAGNTLSSPTNTQRSVVPHPLPPPQAFLLTTPPKTTPKHLLLLKHLSFNLLLVRHANLSSGTWSNLCSVSTVPAGEGQWPITKQQEAQATSHSLGRERGRLWPSPTGTFVKTDSLTALFFHQLWQSVSSNKAKDETYNGSLYCKQHSIRVNISLYGEGPKETHISSRCLSCKMTFLALMRKRISRFLCDWCFCVKIL